MADLAAAGSRVRAVLEEVFAAASAIGDAFAAQRRGCAAAGSALTAGRLAGLREVIWQQLGQMPAADGAGVVAANTAHWISGTRLDRMPAAGDGTFAAVTDVGADSGWRLAATSA